MANKERERFFVVSRALPFEPPCYSEIRALEAALLCVTFAPLPATLGHPLNPSRGIGRAKVGSNGPRH